MFASAKYPSATHTGASPQATKPLPFFQAKLTVNTPGDAHEREADAVADQVMRMKTGDAPIIQRMPLTPISAVQRACANCEKEKEGVQRKETGGGDASGKAAPSIVSDVLSSSGGHQMDGSTRQFMESRFGQDFSQVRIHTDSRAAESASAIQARAYTSGRHVVFGSGEYQPSSEGGQRLLAHELVHVGQQQGGKTEHSKVQRSWWKGLFGGLGAGLGMAIGSFAGPLGMLLGGVIGGLAGFFGGTQFGKKGGQDENGLRDFSSPQQIFTPNDRDTERNIDVAIITSPTISPHIGRQIREGIRIEGTVRYYYDRKSFETAQAGIGNSTHGSENVGGFYDRKTNRIHLPPSPRLESLIHEAIHRFSADFRGSSFINEGLTQLFTNVILRENGISNGIAYPNQLRVAEAIRDKIGGEQNLARIFFSGGLKVLTDAVLINPETDRGEFISLANRRATDELIRFIREH